MDMRISPLNIKIMLESNPLKSRILVRRLAVVTLDSRADRGSKTVTGALGACCGNHAGKRARGVTRRADKRQDPLSYELHIREDLSTGYGLRFSMEIYGRKRFSTNTYRKLVLFLQKSAETSGSLREKVI